MPTFDTPEPISATVDIVFGDIWFIAGDRADTVVEVRPVDPSREVDVEAAEQATIEFADGRLLVAHPKLRTAFTTKYGSVKVLVELPTGSDVQGDTEEGEYLIKGAVGSCRLRNAIGDIRVGQATGVRLRTAGGKVIVDHVTGQADVSGNGDIRIRRIDGGAVVENAGGDSWIGEVAGDLLATSTEGDITVEVAHAAISAGTANGHVRVGEIGSGTADLYAAIGKLEVGIPQDTDIRLDAPTSPGYGRAHPTFTRRA
ncbi:DUF4097 family beta strand repeat-containing protein [Nonomuraea jiangxiensis]|uniref:Adhesin n=1 Tax=Nonomuraea jiangxiensis TaxID=633440 RepID=A0A1G8M1C6_9ACTN|nr:hypothetical protein [Nonomuraea jiangxiensis]SDI61748.1 hypothetical protein SAMN05421869_106273 [Nonomuraea jiangxiensis]